MLAEFILLESKRKYRSQISGTYVNKNPKIAETAFHSQFRRSEVPRPSPRFAKALLYRDLLNETSVAELCDLFHSSE